MTKINEGDKVRINRPGSIFDGCTGVVVDKLPFPYSLRYTVRMLHPADFLHPTGFFSRREIVLLND